MAGRISPRSTSRGTRRRRWPGCRRRTRPRRCHSRWSPQRKRPGLAALDRAVALGYRRFRLSLGESHRFEAGWMDAEGMRRVLETLPDAANSGDVYAV